MTFLTNTFDSISASQLFKSLYDLSLTLPKLYAKGLFVSSDSEIVMTVASSRVAGVNVKGVISNFRDVES